MATVLDLFQSKNLTSSIKDLEGYSNPCRHMRQCHTMQHLQRITQCGRQRCVTRCSGHVTVTLRIVLQHRQEYKTLLLFRDLQRSMFFALQVAKRGCHAQFSSSTFRVTLEVAGNAARVFVRHRVRLKPPGIAYTCFDEVLRGK